MTISRQIPAKIIQITGALRVAGFKAYLVGGCVRDRLLGRALHDYDIATDATPQEISMYVPNAREVGAAFNVMMIDDPELGEINITTFRKEGDYRNYRHPSFVTVGTIEDDAARRDFTINAMYENVTTGKILDFHNGLDDLNHRILRAVGDPYKRIKEDALRMLRGVRFSAEFGLTFDTATFGAIVDNSQLLCHISKERITEELRRMLTGSDPALAVELLQRTGLFREIFCSTMTNSAATIAALRTLHDRDTKLSMPVGLATILAQVRPTPDGDAPRLRLPMKEVTAIRDLLALCKDIARMEAAESSPVEKVRRLAGDPLGEDAIDIYRALKQGRGDSTEHIDRLIRSCDKWRASPETALPKAIITGSILIKMGCAPHRGFAQCLDKIYDAQLRGEFDSIDSAKPVIERILGSIPESDD